MSDLCERLQDVNEAGVYRLSCPVAVLEANVALAGFRLLEINLSDAEGKGAFLAAMAQVLKAPEWFGHNWDALSDVLGDLSWLPVNGYVLMLCNGGDHLGLGESDFNIVSDIFDEAVGFWKTQNKPFWVFFADEL